ncbi:MAG: amidohydrolase family protein, partial [Persicimonas sp.]
MTATRRASSFSCVLAAICLVLAACGPDDPSNNESNGADVGVDGGSPDAGPDADPDGGSGGGEVVTCENEIEPAPDDQSCSVESGASNLLMLEGDVLAGDTVYENGQVFIDRSAENAEIVCTGCDCAEEADAESATTLSCPETVISPGLVNAHEHLGWGAAPPKPHGEERYDHRHDWREGLRGHDEISSGAGDYSSESILFGELRHMLSGATTIAGSTRGGAADGFLRNMDNPSSSGGLEVDVEYETFPLGDVSGTLRDSGCDYPDIDGESALQNDIYLPHIGEGIDPEAQNEYACLSSSDEGGVDLIEDHTSVIHGVGMTAADIADFAANGAELVWSPRTNIDLYGNTADVITYDNYGVDIALGTDWLISGSMNLSRELACVDHLNQNHYNNHFSDYEIFKMATENGAISMGVGDQLGRIEEGYIADITLFDASERSDYRAVIGAELEDVELVMRGGDPLVGESPLVDALLDESDADQCETIDLCETERTICAERDTGLSYE